MEASGTWLRAGDVLEASEWCREGIVRGRRDARRREAVRIARKRLWRPWQITYKAAHAKVMRSSYAYGWWYDDDERAYALVQQSRAIPPDQKMFVSVKDFASINIYYLEIMSLKSNGD